MSGGSWDYAYRKIEDVAERLQQDPRPYHQAFGDVVSKVAHVMHLIEWADSCDISKDDALAAIKEFLGEQGKPIIVGNIKRDAVQLRALLDSIINDTT